MANKSNNMKYFWSSLPGILTGVAAVISAIGGILIIFYGGNSTPDIAVGPAIESFEASPDTIVSGEYVTLKWDTSDATHVTIDPGVGSVGLSGSKSVSPTETTTYTLTAIKNGESDVVTEDVKVVVGIGPHYYEEIPPTIESFEANPDNIVPGKDVTLSWSVSDAADVTINPGIGSVESNGSITVCPTETTTYTLTATNDAESVESSKVVSVLEIESFETIPDNIVSGEDVTLSWNVSGATYVTLNPGIGNVNLSGSITVRPTETTTYILKAANRAESVNSSKIVSVEEPDLEIEFVNISAGTFMMGSPSDEIGRQSDEGPVHEVTIEAFELGKYEVTQEQWREVMDSNLSKWTGDDLPVGHVSKNDVEEFIEKLNEREGTDKYRLPTEAEWEYACRAGTDTMYSFGDDGSKLGNYAWYKTNSGGRYHPVGQKKPNPWGLYDMYGNVWEWVQDDSHYSYNGAPSDGSAWGSGDTSRGGSFYSISRFCRSANRNGCDPEDTIGFRLVREL